MLKVEPLKYDWVRVYDENIELKGEVGIKEEGICFEEVMLDKIKYCIKQRFDQNLMFFITPDEYKKLEDETINCFIITIEEKEIEIRAFCGLEDFESKWNLRILADAVKKQLNYETDIVLDKIVENCDECNFQFIKKFKKDIIIEKAIKDMIEKIENIIRIAENIPGRVEWKEEYQKDEMKFCKELLTPLFMRMHFQTVKYVHGIFEYGKDYYLSIRDPFGIEKYYGVQVKAGDISGEVNSKIDMIIGQIQDAFLMPIEETNQYISTLIIIISGHYSYNARKKIIAKIPENQRNNIVFLEKEDIENLIEKYWK